MMKNFYVHLLLSAVAFPMSAEYATPGDGRTYTLESLSAQSNPFRSKCTVRATSWRVTSGDHAPWAVRL
jgi:hypothetical protein